MRQSADCGATVRGGRHLENLAQADAFVFDKTNTLTKASPSIRECQIKYSPLSNDVFQRASRMLANHRQGISKREKKDIPSDSTLLFDCL
ncbi:MAG: hypothetical protein ABR512_08700 [Desulfopila sp.]